MAVQRRSPAKPSEAAVEKFEQLAQAKKAEPLNPPSPPPATASEEDQKLHAAMVRDWKAALRERGLLGPTCEPADVMVWDENGVYIEFKPCMTAVRTKDPTDGRLKGALYFNISGRLRVPGTNRDVQVSFSMTEIIPKEGKAPRQRHFV